MFYFIKLKKQLETIINNYSLMMLSQWRDQEILFKGFGYDFFYLGFKITIISSVNFVKLRGVNPKT